MSVTIKNLTFTQDEINSICEAIIIAQNSIGDKKSGLSSIDWNNKINNKISALDDILKKIYTTEYRKLPEPEDLQESSVCDKQQQSLPFSDL